MREKLYNVWYQPCESHVWHLQIHAVPRVAAENIIESLLRQRYHTMLEEYTPSLSYNGIPLIFDANGGTNLI